MSVTSERREKRCAKCGEVKDASSDFTWRANGKSRVMLPYPLCKVCRAAEMRERYHTDAIYRAKARIRNRDSMRRAREREARG